MEFDSNIVNNLDKKVERRILLKGGLIYDILSALFLILGVLSIINGDGFSSLTLLIPSAIFAILGIKKLFIKGEERKRYLVSKLLLQSLKDAKRNGINFSTEEIEKIRFKYDPIFHDKVVQEAREQSEEEYNLKLKDCENYLKQLLNDREEQVSRIYEERWKNVADGKLYYNLVEGKIRFNENEYFFSSIKGAEISKTETYRIYTTETGASKKHGSVIGAVAGAAVLGPIGAVVGGTSLGGTSNSGQSVSNSIPVCHHLGVLVDIDGFKDEIFILNKTVDQTSKVYVKALQSANNIVNKLHQLSTQPVPENPLQIEDEKIIKDIDKKIEKAKLELDSIKTNYSKHNISHKYEKL